MRKVIAAGLVSVAVAVLPVASSFAATSVTDVLSITVDDSCSISASSRSNTGGDGTWTGNTLSANRTVGSVSYNLGSTTFSVTCNDPDGYMVTVATQNLMSGSNSIPAYSGTAYSASVSGWAPANGSTSSATKYKNGDVVDDGTGIVANGRTFTIYYGVGISPTHQAGTYTSNSAAVYTLTKI